MTTEERPDIERWNSALEELQAAKEARKAGKASEDDVKRAQQKYDEASDAI